MIIKRFFALCYDLFLLICIWIILSLVLVIALQGKPIPPNTLWYQLLLAAVAQAFFVGFWCYGKGQTVGLKAWGLRLVVDADATSGSQSGSQGAISLKQGILYFWVGILSLGYRNNRNRSWAERVSGLRLVFRP